MGLFEVLSEIFKPQHNETIISLQDCKHSENGEDGWENHQWPGINLGQKGGSAESAKSALGGYTRQ